MSATPEIQASYHRTRDGLLAARVEERCFLALPESGGRICVAYDSGVNIPPELWTAEDICGRGRMVDGEDGFRDYVEERAIHRRQLSGLQRPSVKSGAHTPWGCADRSKLYAEGIVEHETPEHGGFHLDAVRNAMVDPAWRNDDGWYEENCEWARVAFAFPGLFTDFERRCADETLRHREPDAYERVNGVVLQPGESNVTDRRRFKRDHVADWIVVSAITSRHTPGFVECVAKLGGDRRCTEERRYLVLEADYEVGRFGFVIDPARHAPYDGPSDFIGWIDKGA